MCSGDRAEAFGWSAIQIDGHDVDQIDRAYRDAVADERPTLIVARTEKGHGVSFLANQENWHGKAVPADRLDEALGELGGDRGITVHPADAARAPHHDRCSARAPPRPRPRTTVRSPRARRSGTRSPGWPATYDDVVVLDGEVGQLDLHGGGRGRRAGALLPAVHRRAVHGRRPERACRPSARRRSPPRSARS